MAKIWEWSGYTSSCTLDCGGMHELPNEIQRIFDYFSPWSNSAKAFLSNFTYDIIYTIGAFKVVMVRPKPHRHADPNIVGLYVAADHQKRTFGEIYKFWVIQNTDHIPSQKWWHIFYKPKNETLEDIVRKAVRWAEERMGITKKLQEKIGLITQELEFRKNALQEVLEEEGKTYAFTKHPTIKKHDSTSVGISN